MYSKEILNRYIEIAGYINSNYGYLTVSIHVILVIVLFLSVYNSFKNPGIKSSNQLKILISVTYMYGGLFFLFGYNVMTITEFMSFFGMVFIGLIALLMLRLKDTIFKLSDKKDLQILGIFFMIGGAVLYPFLEILTGMNYPGIVLIGTECPTTTFLCGLFISSLLTVNRYLLIGVFAYTVISGISAISAGAYVDIIYSLSGIFGLLMLIKYRKLIFITKK